VVAVVGTETVSELCSAIGECNHARVLSLAQDEARENGVKLQSLSGEPNSPLGKADTAGGEVVPAGVAALNAGCSNLRKAAYLLF